jgi:hypothetical protein
MEQVFDRFHAPVPIWLLLDDDGGRAKNPRLFVEVPDQTRKYPIGMHGRHTRHVPLMDLLRQWINQTHC